MTGIDALADRTRGVYRDAGFTGGFQWGQRSAILVVDFSCGFTDPDCPLGSGATAGVEPTRRLLDAARLCRVFVVFTTIAYDPGSRAATTWLGKVPSLGELTVGSARVGIDPRLGRRPGVKVVTKIGASAFFGTPVHAVLVGHCIDTVSVLGATTSGCVHTSVADSVQHGLPTFVVSDCCADRSAGPHEANLFDMTAKYADACTAEEVMRYFEGLTRTVAG